MNLNYAECRNNLIEKYNVIGMIGEGIKPISVESSCALNTYVVGDVLRTMCKSPKSNLYNEVQTDGGIILHLTEKGVQYLKNNIHSMIDEYKTFISTDNICAENEFEGMNDIPLKSKFVAKNTSIDALVNADLVNKNGVAVLVEKDNHKNSLLNQNAYGSTSANLSEDLMYANSLDEAIIGPRKSIKSSRFY